MGTLKPGATYIYERADGVIYAREFGKTERRVIGYDNIESVEHKRVLTELNEVVKMCETDPAMKEMLDQLFVVYNLKKTNE